MNTHEEYTFLNIPQNCFLGSTVFKNVFYDKAELSTSDKKLFTEVIQKIRWLYSLKPDTIHIAPYKDEVRDYSEVEIIEVLLHSDTKVKRIAEIIMRAIPYPMLLVFRLESSFLFYVAHQRLNQSDSSKNTIEEFIATSWIDSDSDFLAKLDIKKMSFTNFYTFYTDIVDTISIHNLSIIMPTEDKISGEEARKVLAQIDSIEQEIAKLRATLKKGTQFNRRMELNIKIKKLEQNKDKLLGGDING